MCHVQEILILLISRKTRNLKPSRSTLVPSMQLQEIRNDEIQYQLEKMLKSRFDFNKKVIIIFFLRVKNETLFFANDV